MFRSLRVRLALSHAFVMLVILTIFAGLLLLLLARNLDRGATDQLLAEAGAQVERIQEGGAFAPTTDVDVPSASAVQIAVYRSGEVVPVGEPREIPSWPGRTPIASPIWRSPARRCASSRSPP